MFVQVVLWLICLGAAICALSICACLGLRRHSRKSHIHEPYHRTSAAELFYLRHLRSCAATAVHAQKRHSSPRVVCAVSGLSLRQGMFTEMSETLHCHLGAALRLLVQHKLWTTFTLRSVLTPLEFAACFHIVDCMTQTHEVQGGAQRAANLAIAWLSLGLSIMGWHVPQTLADHSQICRILSALAMHCLYDDYKCVALAFLLPTFGKRPKDYARESADRAVAPRIGGEDVAMPAAEPPAACNAATDGVGPTATDAVGTASSSACGSATTPVASATDFRSLAEVAVAFEPLQSEDEFRKVFQAVRVLMQPKKDTVHDLCTTWDVRRYEHKHNRPLSVITEELSTAVLRRACLLWDTRAGTDSS